MADAVAPLDAEIRRLIKIAGPMPVRHYMAMCLTHAQHGYYMTRDPLGSEGDFTTSPEISQMFGELIGLWMASVWRRMGSPNSLRLIELGPGRGTMMLDAIRAARVMPGFRSALSVHLVETSPALQQRQRQTLAGLETPCAWHATLSEVPEGPTIVVANEFFDAVPVNQAVKKGAAWHERVIEADANGNLHFGIAPEPIPNFVITVPRAVRDAPNGAIFEWRSNTMTVDLCRRIVNGGGAALMIDYGHVASAVGDTFQAVRKHGFANPLASPGLVDLTAHVDFQAITLDAETMGARVHGPIEQAEFLRRMGVDTRADALKAVVTPTKADEIEAARLRLTAGGPTGMGTLFKVLGLSHPKLESLPAFEKAGAEAPADPAEVPIA
jgi:NADH dehydrogenase [ubiquinone] 1 alpha subcomplex assembly factor 7